MLAPTNPMGKTLAKLQQVFGLFQQQVLAKFQQKYPEGLSKSRKNALQKLQNWPAKVRQNCQQKCQKNIYYSLWQGRFWPNHFFWSLLLDFFWTFAGLILHFCWHFCWYSWSTSAEPKKIVARLLLDFCWTFASVFQNVFHRGLSALNMSSKEMTENYAELMLAPALRDATRQRRLGSMGFLRGFNKQPPPSSEKQL